MVPPQAEAAPIVGESLDDATRLEDAGDGRFVAQVSPAWEIWGPNGGYLAALALRAAGARARIPQPAPFHATFLRSPRFDEVTLDVTVLKAGRRAETFSVTMSQDGRPVLAAMVQTAAIAPGYDGQAVLAPDVPPAEMAPPLDFHAPYAFWHNVDLRSAAELGQARLTEWVRFRPVARFDDPFLEAARPLILLDTYGWPAAYRTYGGGPFIAPNLDTSAWFYPATSATDWLLIDHEYQVAGQGRLGVAGRVWDENGRLIATGAAQLCCLPADGEPA